jgi:hypothetical protein
MFLEQRTSAVRHEWKVDFFGGQKFEVPIPESDIELAKNFQSWCLSWRGKEGWRRKKVEKLGGFYIARWESYT